MKRFICIFSIFICFISFSFPETNLFSLVSLNDFINIEKKQSFSDSLYFYSFEKDVKSNIKEISVNLKGPERNENYVLIYNSKGLLEKEYREILEKYTVDYVYDEKDRILSCRDFTFKYINDFTRESYCRGQLQSIESIEYLNNKILITVKFYSKKYDDNSIIEMGKNIYEYNFSNGNLINITCTSYNLKGIEKKKKNYLFLTYEDGKIKTSKEYYGEELRCEQIFEYKDNNLIKRTVTYPYDTLANYTAEYSDFDKYGNFKKYLEKKINKNTETIFTREIEYYRY